MSMLNFFANLTEAPHAIGAIIGIPSALIYAMELWILYKNWNKFGSPFFVLFSLRAIINLVNLFSSYLGQRFLRFGWFLPIYQNAPSWLLAIAYFFIYYPFHVENFLTFFLLLNRLTSVAFPLRHEKFWTMSFTRCCALASYAVPLLFTLHMVQYRAYVLNTNGTYLLTYQTPKDGIIALVHGQQIVGKLTLSNTGVMAISSILFMFICGAINCYTLWHYRRRNTISQQAKKQQPQQQMFMLTSIHQIDAEKERTETKLTVYAMLTFGGQLLISVYMILWYIVSTPIKSSLDPDTYYALNLVVLNQGPWVNDLCTVALPAWLMLWANDRIRKLTFRLIPWQ